MIFITGATGFIGSHLGQFLTDKGHPVLGIDTSPNRPAFLAKSVQINQLSVTQKDQIEDLFKSNSISTVLHLGMTSTPKDAKADPRKARESIIEGTEILIELCLKYKVKNFTFFSSSHVYGDVNTDSVSEDMSGAPKSDYGKYKLEAEKICLEKLKGSEISHTIIRPTSVYGPHDPGMRVINKFIDRAQQGLALSINDHQSLMDFTFIEDFLEGVNLLLSKGPFQGEVFNLSRGRGRTLLEACEIIKTHYPNLEVHLKESSDVNQTKKGCLDITKARTLLGFKPQFDLEQGIAKIITTQRINE